MNFLLSTFGLEPAGVSVQFFPAVPDREFTPMDDIKIVPASSPCAGARPRSCPCRGSRIRPRQGSARPPLGLVFLDICPCQDVCSKCGEPWTDDHLDPRSR